MNDLLKQISSYNLFNYLLPGAVFCLLAEQATTARVIVEPLFLAFFYYYFVGMIVSRVGSLVVEPTVRIFKFVEFAPYADYIKASKIDSKIDLLSEANNTYRSIASIGICLLLYVFGYSIAEHIGLSLTARYVSISIAVSILFLFSFRKQTTYIKQRIAVHLSQEA